MFDPADSESDRSRKTLRAVRKLLVDVSRHHSRVPHEAEDVAHDIVLAALRRGLPVTHEGFVRSARGAARRHAAFLARSAARRQARDMLAATQQLVASGVDDEGEGGDASQLTDLPPALRTTLSLLLLGLDKAELRFALGVTDAALRKRFQALRELGPLARPELRLPARSSAGVQLRRSQVELLPRLMTRAGHDGLIGRVLSVGDPDGHGLIFAEVLTSGRRTATVGAPANPSAAPEKGPTCSTASSRTSRSSST